MSIEQMCRDLLTQAVADGLVGDPPDYDDPRPCVRTGGELVGMANLLQRMLAEVVVMERERCAKVAESKPRHGFWADTAAEVPQAIAAAIRKGIVN